MKGKTYASQFQNLLRTREVGELVGGALAGAMTKAVLAPLETIRTRMVVGVGSKHIAGSFIEIIEHNGWQGLWAGNTINILRIIPTQAIELGTFECVKRAVTSAREKWKESECPKVYIGNFSMDLSFPWVSSVAIGGAAAGIVSTLVCHPLEVIEDRLTVNHKLYPSITLAFSKIYKDDGLGGFYAGISPTLIGMLPYSTCYYFMYETMKKSYCQAKKKEVFKPSRAAHSWGPFRACSKYYQLSFGGGKEEADGWLPARQVPKPHGCSLVRGCPGEGPDGSLPRLGCKLFEGHAYVWHHLDVL